jgi:signal transduction histidine kinase
MNAEGARVSSPGADALGGSITVQSAPGNGTRITAELPLDPGSGASAE